MYHPFAGWSVSEEKIRYPIQSSPRLSNPIIYLYAESKFSQCSIHNDSVYSIQFLCNHFRFFQYRYIKCILFFTSFSNNNPNSSSHNIFNSAMGQNVCPACTYYIHKPVPMVWSTEGPVTEEGVWPLCLVQSKSSSWAWVYSQKSFSKLQSILDEPMHTG